MDDHFLEILTLSALAVAAVITVLSTRLLRAVIALAMTSVLVTVVLFQLEAPLAAVFELSVCAGLISAVFLSIISLTQPEDLPLAPERQRERLRRYWVLVPLTILLGLGVLQLTLPAFGPAAPGPDVRAVFWGLRHADLLGQATVLLAGAFGVVVLFKETKKHER
jgi:NADH-quinone oxidoreductase subunit J